MQKELAEEKLAKLEMQGNAERQTQQNNEFVENVRQQLMNAQMHITNLELSKAEDREIINEKELEIAALKRQLADMSIEHDGVAALRTQVRT